MTIDPPCKDRECQKCDNWDDWFCSEYSDVDIDMDTNELFLFFNLTWFKQDKYGICKKFKEKTTIGA